MNFLPLSRLSNRGHWLDHLPKVAWCPSPTVSSSNPSWDPVNLPSVSWHSHHCHLERRLLSSWPPSWGMLSLQCHIEARLLSFQGSLFVLAHSHSDSVLFVLFFKYVSELFFNVFSWNILEKYLWKSIQKSVWKSFKKSGHTNTTWQHKYKLATQI